MCGQLTRMPDKPLKLLLAAALAAGPEGFMPSAPNLAPGSRSSPVDWSTSRMLSVRRSPEMATTFTHTSCPRLTTSRAAAGLRMCSKVASAQGSCSKKQKSRRLDRSDATPAHHAAPAIAACRG